MRQIGDFRLAGDVLQRGGAFGEGGGHQQMFGGADGDEGEDDVGAGQPAGGAGFDIAAFKFDLRPHGLQPFEVEVHRAGADGIAAGQRDAGLAGARQQRAQHQEGGADFADDLIRGHGVGDGAAERETAAVRLHADAVLGEQGGHGGEVRQFGDVGQGQALIGEQAAGHERQGRVFGAGDGDGAVKRHTAGDANRVHLYFYILGSETPRWPIYLPDLSA